MFGKFLPRTPIFHDDFDQMASIVASSAQILLDLVSDNVNSSEKFQQIEQLENEADIVERHCVQLLHKTFITPFERDDIFNLVSELDDIIDTIEEIAARFVIYKLTDAPSLVKTMASTLNLATKELVKLVLGLRKLTKIEEMRQLIAHIHILEHETDQLQRKGMEFLFDNEKDPITLMKWKEIYELFEHAVDRCEDVANSIEGVIIEQT